MYNMLKFDKFRLHIPKRNGRIEVFHEMSIWADRERVYHQRVIWNVIGQLLDYSKDVAPLEFVFWLDILAMKVPVSEFSFLKIYYNVYEIQANQLLGVQQSLDDKQINDYNKYIIKFKDIRCLIIFRRITYLFEWID